ncbi:hypothetical protein [Rhodococcus sp. PSBB049]|uniref:hypothetical protein n=1 Tax=Rhodococcus sp. PSBB049 TaxID=2812863 RepID=UPI0019810ADE|nr:hypothetical protein [Rhodococcus sp. PSBB049]QSE72201.1 hypothetical protein JYA91_27845 [Rhodococcus sp. PSBB049]
MTTEYDWGACADFTEHQDPQPLDDHRWRCEVCGTEWTETDDVDVEVEPSPGGVRLTIGSALYSLNADTAHMLVDRLQVALRESAKLDTND